MNKQTIPTEIQNLKSHHDCIILLPSFAGGMVGGKVGGWVGSDSVKEREKQHQLSISSVAKRGRPWSHNSSGESVILTTVFFENLVPTVNQPKPVKTGSNHPLNIRLKAWNVILPQFSLPSGSQCNQTVNYKVVLILI